MTAEDEGMMRSSIVTVTLEPKRPLHEIEFSSDVTSNELILPQRPPTREISVRESMTSLPLPSTSTRQLTFTELPPGLTSKDLQDLKHIDLEEFSIGYGSYKSSSFDPKLFVDRLHTRIQQTRYPKVIPEEEEKDFQEIPIYFSTASNVIQFTDDERSEFMKLDVPSVCYLAESGQIAIIIIFIFTLLFLVYYLGFF